MKQHIRLVMSCVLILHVHLGAVVAQPGENLWRVLAGIGITLDGIAVSVGDDLKSKVCVIEQIIDDFGGGSSPCAATPISQSDVMAGSLILSTSGTGYCLAEDITADVSITATDVTLDLNKHVLNGTIIVFPGADRPIIRNGTIQAPAPIDNSQANSGAVLIAGNKARVLNVCIFCDATTVDDVDGRTGILNAGRDAIIDGCFVQAGMSGILTTTSEFSSGGTGIANTSAGDNVQILNSVVYGGKGRDNTGLITANALSTASGGPGITLGGPVPTLKANSCCVIGCKVTGGDSGSLIAVSTIATGSSTTVGEGGSGIECFGDDTLIKNSIVSGGSSGLMSAAISIGTASGIATIGNGGSGIEVIGDRISINQCTINSGNSGGVTSGSIAHGGVVNCGQGGWGIIFGGDVLQATECVITTGSGGDMVATVSGIAKRIGSVSGGASVGSGGIGIASSFFVDTKNMCVAATKIITGSGGDIISTSTVSASISSISVGTGSATFLGTGGQGIYFDGENLKVIDCNITTGTSSAATSQGDIGSSSALVKGNTGSSGIVNFSAGATCIQSCRIQTGPSGTIHAGTTLGATSGIVQNSGGGIGIEVSFGSSLAITDCQIVTGDGGDSLADISSTATAANGGIGIAIDRVEIVKIDGCSICSTGSGGSGTNTGGRGGDGIQIESSSSMPVKELEIVNTIVENTGNGGNGGVVGGAAGSGVRIDSSGGSELISVLSTEIKNTGAGGNSTFVAGDGGFGIESDTSGSVLISDCLVTDLGRGGSSTSASGGAGGAGISLTSPNSMIIRTTVNNTGQGGNSSGVAGADGGNGIQVFDDNNKIYYCTVSKTGNGGTGTSTGNGGHGIFIAGAATGTEASNCAIQYTGTGSTGGKAILDMGTGSVIFSNMAHNIANATAYTIVAGAAVDGTTGTAFAAGTDRLSNVHKP